MTSVTYECTTCGTLGPAEYGYSKYGHPEDAAPLPDAAYHLEELASNVSGGRGHAVRRCPECGAWFHYELDYEFLVNGSEDYETLTRITEEEARAIERSLTK